jgi:hypothetical protein
VSNRSVRRALGVAAVLFLVACGSAGSTAGPSPSGAPLTISQLKFAVMDAIGQPDYCDPDFYPIARDGGEQANADAQYPTIKADAELYSTIVAHEHLPSGDLDAQQRLGLYRAFKNLRALTLTAGEQSYTFQVRVRTPAGGSAGVQLITGSVSLFGDVKVASRVASGPPNCPICLSASTLIETPRGPVHVTELKPGMEVWTSTPDGARISAPIIQTGNTEVPAGHLMVHLQLADGRELWASPGHPTADGTPLGKLAIGSTLDASKVTLWELVPYGGDRTYDLLPAGATGTYWANGILLGSTLRS